MLEDPHSSAHLFISVTLSFPGRKSITTHALVDSGATASFISSDFVKRHSLPLALKPDPMPVYTVGSRPLVSGSVTYQVLTRLNLRAHSENIALGVVQVSYPVILGLDWLRRHNPAVDWVTTQLSFSCCNLSTPMSVFGLGSGLLRNTSVPRASVASVGIGFGLSFTRPRLVPDPAPVTVTPTSARCDRPLPTPSLGTYPSIGTPPSLVNPVQMSAGSGLPGLMKAWVTPSPPLCIKILSKSRFRKFAKNQRISAIKFTPGSDGNASVEIISAVGDDT